MSVSAIGRCAEVQLTAWGAARDAVLSGAVGALRAALPRDVKLEISFAARALLDCLRRASLALQAELVGSARACEAFLAAARAPAAGAGGAAAADVEATVAGLQSATDARMSVLHALLG